MVLVLCILTDFGINFLDKALVSDLRTCCMYEVQN